VQSKKEDLFSLLWAWKGSFEKVLGVMASILAGMVKLGMSHKPIGCKTGPWAFRQSHKPKPYPIRKSKSKHQFYSKGLLKPSSITKFRSDPVPETSETSTKDTPDVPPTVGLVSGTSKTLTKNMTEAPPMVGLILEISVGVSVGSPQTSSGIADVP